MTQIKAPDGTIVEFPDGTPDDVMAKAMQETFGGPPAAPISTARDVAESFASGVPRGAIETAMAPVTMNRMASDAGGWLFDKAEGPIRSALGMDPAVPGPAHDQFKDMIINPLTGLVNAGLGAITGAPTDIRSGVNAGQDKTREAMDAMLHKPQTTAGEVAGTLGEFAAPGALPSKAARMAPGIASKVGRYAEEALGNVVAPAVTSEAAGQATEGTQYEGLARFLGALFGNVGAAATRAHNTPDAMIRQHTVGTTPEQWAEAQRLQDNGTGIALPSSESHAQARGGASALPDLMRLVESSPAGKAVTGPFYGARPGQVDRAVASQLDQIAPQHPQPSTLGPAAAEAAQKAISATPQGQELLDAITGAGPRTTALEAGQAIQEPLRGIYDRREGMRAALGDQDYAAARKATPSIPVDGLAPETTTVRPAYTSIQPTAAEGEKVATSMTPVAVPAKTETPALTSSTGPEAIQADPRDVLKFIDELAPTTKASARTALQQVRQSLFDKGGVDTSVTGLDATRHQIGDMINVATRSGENHTAAVLQQVQEKLDQTLMSVPEYGQAKKNFAAASAPLEPFASPGMSKAIERDPYNKRFSTAPEDVPAALSSPTEAKNFGVVAPTEARVAYENHLATQILDKATGANGAIDANRLAMALRDNQDVLSQFPAVAERLNKIVGADVAMAPARAGPVGRVAAATDTATAGNAILPQNPLSGSAPEAADAVQRLAAQDPAATAGLVRQNLGDRYSAAQTETQGGSRESAGAKFHKSVAGNDQRQQVLDAVLRALPGGQAAAPAMTNLLEVLQATMRRKGEGSPTASLRAGQDMAGAGSFPQVALDFLTSLGTSLVTKAGDATKRARMRGNQAEIANTLTGPDAVQRTRAAADRRPAVSYPESVLRTLLESGQTLQDPRGGR